MRGQRLSSLDSGTAAFLCVFIIIIIGAVIYRSNVENECTMRGGHVKWLVSSSDNGGDYLCLSPDGRILYG